MKFGYPEYKDLIECFLEAAVDRLGTGLVSVILFGSVARGEAEPESDIDLLLVVEECAASYEQRTVPVIEIIGRVRRHACWRGWAARGQFPEINVIVLTKQEASENWAIFLDMMSDSIILRDRDGFFSARLRAMRARVDELGAVKFETPSGWYWDLKPDLRLGEAVHL